MVDATVIQAGLSSLKSLMDLAKAVKEMDATVDRNGLAIEFQEKILAAQTAQSALVDTIGDLEKKLTCFETWESEKERYELHEIRNGQFVYRTKETMEPSEPPHQICASCYQHSHKSILQSQNWMPGRCEVLICMDCGSVIYVTGSPYPDHAKLRPKTTR